MLLGGGSSDAITTYIAWEGLNAWQSGAAEIARKYSMIETAAQRANSAGDGMMAWGAGLGVTGAGLLRVAGSTAEVSRQAEDADTKLRSMLGTRGELDKFGELQDFTHRVSLDAGLSNPNAVKEAASSLLGFGVSAERIEQIMPGLIGQAQHYDISLRHVADAFGRAFSSGNINSMRRGAQITFTPEETKAFKDFQKSGASWAQQQQRIFDMVQNSLAKYALKAGAGLSDLTRAQNRYNLELRTTEEEMGKGSSDVQLRFYQLAATALGEIEKHPTALKFLGEGAAIGGGLMAVGGPIMAAVGAWEKYATAKALAQLAQERETGAEAAKLPILAEETEGMNLSAAAAERMAEAKAAAALATEDANAAALASGAAVTIGEDATIVSGAAGSMAAKAGLLETAGATLGEFFAAAAAPALAAAVVGGFLASYGESHVNDPLDRLAKQGSGLSNTTLANAGNDHAKLAQAYQEQADQLKKEGLQRQADDDRDPLGANMYRGVWAAFGKSDDMSDINTELNIAQRMAARERGLAARDKANVKTQWDEAYWKNAAAQREAMVNAQTQSVDNSNLWAPGGDGGRVTPHRARVTVRRNDSVDIHLPVTAGSEHAHQVHYHVRAGRR